MQRAERTCDNNVCDLQLHTTTANPSHSLCLFNLPSNQPPHLEPTQTRNHQVIDLMLAHPSLGRLLAHPSVSHGPTPLYMRGVMEEDTRQNLTRPVRELLGGEGVGAAVQLTVNDKKLSAPLRVRLRLVVGGRGQQ